MLTSLFVDNGKVISLQETGSGFGTWKEDAFLFFSFSVHGVTNWQSVSQSLYEGQAELSSLQC